MASKIQMPNPLPGVGKSYKAPGPWTDQQVRHFVRELRSEWGGVWGYVGTDLREAIMHAKVLAIVRSQDGATVEVAAIDWLTSAMEAAIAAEENA